MVRKVENQKIKQILERNGQIQEVGMIDANISYNQIYFSFDWNWIKDKQIIHRGTDYYGMLIIADIEGRPVKMFGYELISDNYKDKE